MLAANEMVAPFWLYEGKKSSVWHIWFVNVVNEKKNNLNIKIKQVILSGQELNSEWKYFT